ncbi:uncharacterized protein LOC132386174 isoform X2 [Hypanus sabinus]|uniref:uncharacterized protein LOC132386174 isoform X2 n=1 Tax=Hypanus sabinus TaxID=79690 RepID=UPI0028C405F5|nr:uncharacterized protein LOC132386174 isoform X2 [Hypanus sabinus]
MDHTPGGTAWNITRNEKNTFWMVPYILAEDDWLTVDYRMMSVFITIQVIFFPVLAIIALPVNTVTIFILSRDRRRNKESEDRSNAIWCRHVTPFNFSLRGDNISNSTCVP